MNTRVTYIDITPVRAHLQRINDAGVPMFRVARAAGVSNSLAWHVLHLSRKKIRSDNAAALTAVTVEQARNIHVKASYVDDVVLSRLLEGADIRVPAVDKPAYVRVLNARGWSRNRIGRTLKMSGTSVRKALAA
ncbi:hypothetical protein [Nocardia niwae]|uniref:hypothetical protein n=1 Tax=Nocardia niwae TaxID=626084 RepID=UPI000A5961C5|nr:hypothetical protein [Nocardia niwae]